MYILPKKVGFWFFFFFFCLSLLILSLLQLFKEGPRNQMKNAQRAKANQPKISRLPLTRTKVWMLGSPESGSKSMCRIRWFQRLAVTGPEGLSAMRAPVIGPSCVRTGVC